MTLRTKWRFNAIFLLVLAVVLGALLPMPGPIAFGLLGGGIAAFCWWIGDLPGRQP